MLRAQGAARSIPHHDKLGLASVAALSGFGVDAEHVGQDLGDDGVELARYRFRQFQSRERLDELCILVQRYIVLFREPEDLFRNEPAARCDELRRVVSDWIVFERGGSRTRSDLLAEIVEAAQACKSSLESRLFTGALSVCGFDAPFVRKAIPAAAEATR